MNRNEYCVNGKLGYSQSAVARFLGINQSTVSRILIGRNA